MVDVTNEVKQLYQQDSIAKTLTLFIPDLDLLYQNEDFSLEDFSLTEIINSETNLNFMGCISSQMKLKCAVPVQDLRGHYVEVSISANNTTSIPLFKGYVDSQTNLNHQDIITEITAYDKLYQVKDVDVYDWYNSLTFPITILDFRNSLCAQLGITQESGVTLVNDSLDLQKSIHTETINALDVLKWICQANACFGRIGRDGLFHYLQLPEITTSSADVVELDMSSYENVVYETYLVKNISYVKIFDGSGTVLGYGANENNPLCISDNPIAYGLNRETAAQNIYNLVSGLSFEAVQIDCQGLPYAEPGDILLVTTQQNTIRSYILNRTVTGIQALRDTYIASSDEYQTQYKENASDTKLAIERYNRRIADEQNITAINVEQGRITAEISRATGEENRISTLLTATADGLQVQINELYSELDGETQLYYRNGTPTLLNYPAWDFTYNIPCNDTVQLADDLAFEYTDEYYRKNLRAIVYDEENSVTYRFVKSSGVYIWQEVSNTETSLILSKVTALEATTEGIQAEVSQVEANISNNYYTITQTDSKFTQTNNLISQEVTRATTAENSKIDKTNAIQSVSDILADSQAKADAAATTAKNASIAKTASYRTADSIVSAAVAQAATAAGNTYIAKTVQYQTADSIVSSAQSYTNDKLTSYSTISQTSDAISLGVQSANQYTDQHAYAKQSYIDITANGIEISGGKYVKIKSGGTFSVDSGNFSISSAGAVSMKGTVTATGGKIGNLIINDYGLSIRETSSSAVSKVISTAYYAGGASITLSDSNAVTQILGSYVQIGSGSSQSFTLFNGGSWTTICGSSWDINALGNLNIKNKTVSWKKCRDAYLDGDYVLVGDAD